jgi:hypothetical protein
MEKIKAINTKSVKLNVVSDKRSMKKSTKKIRTCVLRSFREKRGG